MQFALMVPPQDNGVFSGIDGDLTDYLGNRLAAERQEYDHTDPHMVVSPGKIERRKGSTSGGWGPGTVIFTTDEVATAIRDAMHYWIDAYGANSAAVEIGTQNPPIVIVFEAGPHIYGEGPGSIYEGKGSLMINNSDQGVEWLQPGMEVIRDLVLVGDLDTTGLFSMPPVWLAHEPHSMSGAATNIDNLRFELPNFRTGTNGDDRFALFASHLPTVPNFHGGRIKVYDQRMEPHPASVPAYAKTDLTDGTTETYSCKWGYRIGARFNLDVRHRLSGLSWHAYEQNQEHNNYDDSVTGDTSHPLLTENNWINLSNDISPYNAFTGGGPGRTFLQVTNRSVFNPGDGSSGRLNVIRCTANRVGKLEGAANFTFYGHDGDVYIKDCVQDGTGIDGVTPSKVGGALSTIQGFNGALPEGRYRHHYAPDPADVKYMMKGLVVDGLTSVNVADNNGKTGMAISGVRALKLRRFKFESWPGAKSILRLGNSNMQSGDNQCGALDLSALVHPDTGDPYVGDFADYAGFPVGIPKVGWMPHIDWWSSRDNSYSLSDAEINVLPALIAEVTLNRSTSTGDGRNTITHPTWGHNASPTLPRTEWDTFESPGQTQVISPGALAYGRVSLEDKTGSTFAGQSHAEVRVPMTVTGDVSRFEIEVGFLDMDNVGAGAGWSIFASGSDVVFPPSDLVAVYDAVWEDILGMPSEPDVPSAPSNIPVRVTAKTGMPAGTYSVDLTLGIPMTEIPFKSGLFEAGTPNTDWQTITVQFTQA